MIDDVLWKFQDLNSFFVEFPKVMYSTEKRWSIRAFEQDQMVQGTLNDIFVRLCRSKTMKNASQTHHAGRLD